MSASFALRYLQRTAPQYLKRATQPTAFRKIHITAQRAQQYPNADLELSPILEAIANDSSLFSGSGLPVDVVKIDTDNEAVMSLAHEHKVGLTGCFLLPISPSYSSFIQVRALPTVIAFRDGKPVEEFRGARNEAWVKEFLQQL
ncbi:hypothetical protein H0H81_011288 [Sphagnurus paluster]|uniref:Thioredoxin domain-containing protein n=1 Tax=Sphagnurus paluster TaxID=117069 RepID=A0A9P7GP72_9AGAR|nr:hypothetical protein H0H81_011288 [Sphagnurus paluster]